MPKEEFIFPRIIESIKSAFAKQAEPAPPGYYYIGGKLVKKPVEVDQKKYLTPQAIELLKSAAGKVFPSGQDEQISPGYYKLGDKLIKKPTLLGGLTREEIDLTGGIEASPWKKEEAPPPVAPPQKLEAEVTAAPKAKEPTLMEQLEALAGRGAETSEELRAAQEEALGKRAADIDMLREYLIANKQYDLSGLMQAADFFSKDPVTGRQSRLAETYRPPPEFLDRYLQYAGARGTLAKERGALPALGEASRAQQFKELATLHKLKQDAALAQLKATEDIFKPMDDVDRRAIVNQYIGPDTPGETRNAIELLAKERGMDPMSFMNWIVNQFAHLSKAQASPIVTKHLAQLIGSVKGP